MFDYKKSLGTESIETLRERLREAEAFEVEAELAELVEQEDMKPETSFGPTTAPVTEAEPLVISDEDRRELPFVTNGLLFVVCGTSERGLNLNRIVQIIPVEDDIQCVILYDMPVEENRFTTQVVQHRVADIRRALRSGDSL